MVITIYQGLTKLFPPTWQHHRLMIVSIIVPIIQWQKSMIRSGENHHGKANLRRDASLLRCTLPRACTHKSTPLIDVRLASYKRRKSGHFLTAASDSQLTDPLPGH